MKAICTIISRNYLAAARCWAASFRQLEPDTSIFTLVVDDIEDSIRSSAESFEIVRPSDLVVPTIAEMRISYTVTEFCTALKPSFLKYLLVHRGVSKLCYFDPDIQFYASIPELWESLERSSILLTPHFLDLPIVGNREIETNILQSGAYNLGFIGLAKTSESERFLDWWEQRLARDCLIAPQRGLFVDQRWIDLVPGCFTGVEICRDRGCNVAYWNLRQRRVTCEQGRYQIGPSPLRFFHFSGFDPLRPQHISKHDLNLEFKDYPELVPLFSEYARELKKQGYEESHARSYGFDSIPHYSFRIPEAARRMWRDSVVLQAEKPERFPDVPLDQLFLRWLGERYCNLEGQVTPFSNLAVAVYRDRLDLRKRFPDIFGKDVNRYAKWFEQFAYHELKLNADFFAEASPHISRRRHLVRWYHVLVSNLYRVGLGYPIERWLGEKNIRRIRELFLSVNK